MTSLQKILDHLQIEIPENKRINDGKKYDIKNKYYYFKNRYYIVRLNKDKWMILDDSKKSRRLLRLYCWSYNSGYGCTGEKYVKYTKLMLNYDYWNSVEHINRCKFDNRSENLRMVTYTENNKSGKQGVSMDKKGNNEYWLVTINDNDGNRVRVSFSIKKLGDAEAKRKELEIEYGYIGE